MREKLIELLLELHTKKVVVAYSERAVTTTVKMIADHLIENGVTVREKGEWVNHYINPYGHPCHCCSRCGFKASHQDKNFCPNCGADMRGDSK